MSRNTSIEWCDHTFNPWQGCVKVSPACAHCYAATLGARFGVEWGPKARRKFQSDSYWTQPLKWNRQAAAGGVRRRVFCASMADVFEQLPKDHPDCAAIFNAREQLWDLIEHTPHLDWLLLTKRPENVRTMVPPAWWGQRFPSNVWPGTTVENQEYAKKRVPALLKVPAPVRFLSCEPLLGPVNLRALSGCYNDDCWNGCMPSGISWVIAGGESGPGARPTPREWYASLRDQCQATGVPFFFKQYGDWYPLASADQAGNFPAAPMTDDHRFVRIGKKEAGRELDGRTWSQFPEVSP